MLKTTTTTKQINKYTENLKIDQHKNQFKFFLFIYLNH